MFFVNFNNNFFIHSALLPGLKKPTGLGLTPSRMLRRLPGPLCKPRALVLKEARAEVKR